MADAYYGEVIQFLMDRNGMPEEKDNCEFGFFSLAHQMMVLLEYLNRNDQTPFTEKQITEILPLLNVQNMEGDSPEVYILAFSVGSLNSTMDLVWNIIGYCESISSHHKGIKHRVTANYILHTSEYALDAWQKEPSLWVERINFNSLPESTDVNSWIENDPAFGLLSAFALNPCFLAKIGGEVVPHIGISFLKTRDRNGNDANPVIHGNDEIDKVLFCPAVNPLFEGQFVSFPRLVFNSSISSETLGY